MNYFITGSTGLVGSYLIQNLALDKKNHLICLIHQKQYKGNIFTNTKFIQGDLNDFESLVSGSKYADIIIHCAAAINPKKNKDYYLVNYHGTRNLVKAALINKTKLFIFFSSWATNPHAGDYAKSKLLAEQEIKKLPRYLIIRPADIFSEQKSHLYSLLTYIKKLPVIPIIGTGEYIVSPIYITDLINAVFYLVKKKEINKTYTLIGPKIYSFNQIINLLLKHLKLKKPIIHIPSTIAYPLIKITDIVNLPFTFTIEKYKRLTAKKNLENVLSFYTVGIKPTTFEEAIVKFNIY